MTALDRGLHDAKALSRADACQVIEQERDSLWVTKRGEACGDTTGHVLDTMPGEGRPRTMTYLVPRSLLASRTLPRTAMSEGKLELHLSHLPHRPLLVDFSIPLDVASNANVQ